MTGFAIPKRASVEDLKDILKAYYIEGAHTEAVSTDSVEATADMGDKVGRQTNFLTSVELISKEGRKRELTEDGESVAEALMGGNETLAKSLMREVLNEWDFTDKIKGFVRMQEPDPVEEDRIMEYLSANASSTDTRGRNTLIQLLVWADILNEDDAGYVLSDHHGDGVDKDSDNSESESSPSNNDTETEQVEERVIEKEVKSEPSEPCEFSINIDVTASDDPADVESVIMAAKRALQRDVDQDNEE